MRIWGEYPKKPECDLCGKREFNLTPMKGHDGEGYMCCKECVSTYETYADMEYERQREDGEV
jgi:transcription elongation factor Elf1